jgi:hypothetical protein
MTESRRASSIGPGARMQHGFHRPVREWAVWLWPSLEAAWQDATHTVRALRRTPTFAIGVTLTLALGIGANAAMFSLVDRLLFRPPARMIDPSSVHRVYLYRSSRGGAGNGWPIRALQGSRDLFHATIVDRGVLAQIARVGSRTGHASRVRWRRKRQFLRILRRAPCARPLLQAERGYTGGAGAGHSAQLRHMED